MPAPDIDSVTLLNLDPKARSRFGEKPFRQWEDVIDKIVSAYPNPIAIHSNGFALTTITVRIREAVRGLLAFKYKTYINVSELEKIWPSVSLIIRDNKVIAGRKESLGIKLKTQSNVIQELFKQVPVKSVTITTDVEKTNAVELLKADSLPAAQPNLLTSVTSPTLGQVQSLFYLYETCFFTTPTRLALVEEAVAEYIEQQTEFINVAYNKEGEGTYIIA